ncbi:MAG: flagellar motor protein MotB [Acetatifactor sp.]|nr:flagellar motor protein MotB [Acetatifactor sp.]
MAKKKPEEPPAGSPAWMATFSDLMNLLLCFFVLLFSMSSVDEAKYAEMIAAMNNTFSIFTAGATAIGEGILISNGVSQLNQLDKYINSTGRNADDEVESDEYNEFNSSGEQSLEEALAEQNLQENEELAEMVEEAVRESNMSDQIEVSFTAQYVQLTMKGALLFDSGSAELKSASTAVLDKVGVILERYAEGTIEIEGHTDNIPISSRRFADNEELSSARALSVFHYLLDNTTVNPVNLKHAGMGQRVPIADNDTEEGRSRNRRVEIKIYNPS